MRRPLAVLAVLAGLMTSAIAVAAIPGADDAKAYTEHDYRRAQLEFNRRTMVEMYDAVGKRDPKWDAQATAFLEAMAKAFTYSSAGREYQVAGVEPPGQLEKLGKAARDAGCDDPLVTYSYGVAISLRNPSGKQVRPLIEQSAAELYTSRYPLNRASAAAFRVFAFTTTEEPEQRQAAWERYKDVTLSLIASWDYKDIDRRLILDQVWDAVSEQDMKLQKNFIEALALQGGADPWVSHVLQGRYEIYVAWEHRGSGFAHTVTEAGWRGMREHLAKARNHFEAALKLEPKFPEPAANLITVAMAASDRPEVEMRSWFDRSVTAQLDYYPAYSNYQYALLPRWHGSHEAMYAFGKECAATKRYDTRVPYQLIDALESIAQDDATPRYWQRPGVYDEVKTVLEAMAERHPIEKTADFYRSYLAAIAWRANQFEESRTLMEALGKRFQPEVFKWLNVMPPLAISHAYAMAPPTGERVTLAEQQAAAGQLDAAVTTYRETLAALPEDHKGARFIRGRATELQWQRSFNAGEWVDIQPDKQLSGWVGQLGKWEVDDTGGLVGTYQPNGLMLMCQAGFLGKDFVVEGNMELGEIVCDGGLAIAPGTPSTYYGLWVQQRDGRTTLARDLYPYAEDEVELRPSNHFRFTFTNDTVSGDFNGKRIFDRTNVDYLFFNPNSKTYIGVGGKWGAKGSKLRFTNLRVKRATGHEPPPEGAASAAGGAGDQHPGHATTVILYGGRGGGDRGEARADRPLAAAPGGAGLFGSKPTRAATLPLT